MPTTALAEEISATYLTDPLWQKIAALDLEAIKFKLVVAQGWPLELADKAENLYKKFLYLSANDKSVVPTKLIDEFWHTHILDTRKYCEDCEHIFGAYLHHFPYLGMRGQDDEQALSHTFASTQQRWVTVFDENLTETGV